MSFVAGADILTRRAIIAAVAALAPRALPAGPQAAPASPITPRARAWNALRSRVSEEKYLNHSLAVEAILRDLAAATGEDQEEWGLAGLLHDIDIAATSGQPARHGVVGAAILRDLGFSQAVVRAVESHDDGPGIARASRLDHALYCADQAYWLILSTGLPFPSARLEDADPKTIWAALQRAPAKQALLGKVSAGCARVGFDLPRLIEAAHAAMRRVSRSLAAAR